MRTLAIEVRPLHQDPRGPQLEAAARAMGVSGIARIDRSQLFFVSGDLEDSHVESLLQDVLTDPLLATGRVRPPVPPGATPGTHIVETALHPGVTDSLAAAVLRASALLQLPVSTVATGVRYELRGRLDDGEVDILIRRLLSNPVIERATRGQIEPPCFPNHETPSAEPAGPVELVELRALPSDALVTLSQARGLALDVTEMRAVQAFFAAEGRPGTDAELETIAQTWSEHCAHKTFRADIEYPDGRVMSPLLRRLQTTTEQIGAPWVRSAFVDNAGIIAFDDTHDVAIKAETHNHPSAIEPFGGANTGAGGVIRDVLGVSARPIALTDVLCFGPEDTAADSLPDGVLHPRRIRAGVVAGIADYGNKIGVPTAAGAIVHHPGYSANPLVFCGCVGVLPTGTHPRDPRSGDRVVVIGGRTGRDGIRGATFSSMTMDASTGEVAGASVQIGDPVVEKGLIDVVMAARDARLYTAITDCGAGGLSSAVGEMAARLGAEVDLSRVPRKYPGLAPWEVWLSEAQERMLLAVPARNLAALAGLCERAEVGWADIGSFREDGRLIVRDGQEPSACAVVDLPGAFLHEGCPRQRLAAVAPSPAPEPAAARQAFDPGAVLLALLSHPDVRSNADVVSGYDHEVLGATLGRPYAGSCDDGPADAAVIRPHGTTGTAALAIAVGLNPQHGLFDPERMAATSVDEAVRNVVAAGADPDRIALLDNFSWGDPQRPQTLGALAAAVDGCCAAALAHRAPFVSGKDSLNNEFRSADGSRRAIPGTLVITAVGIVADGRARVSSDLKKAGNAILLTGVTREELRGSHLDAVLGADGGGWVPAFDPGAPDRYRRIHAAMRAGTVSAAHDLAEGGLAVAAAEMCIAGRMGMAITLPPGLDATTALFSESAGRHLLEVESCHLEGFAASDDITSIGTVTRTPSLVVRTASGEEIIRLDVDALVAAFMGHVPAAVPAAVTGAVTHAATTAAPTFSAAPAAVSRPEPFMPVALLHSRPPTLVLSAFGTNRDNEAAAAVHAAGGEAVIVAWSSLRDKPGLIHEYGLAVVPGGFTYADALGAGALLGLELRHVLMEDLTTFIAAGKPVIGICNGFQALVRAGLLPGALAPNVHGSFECRWVTLLPSSSHCIWTKGLSEPIDCPVAHGEGRYVAADTTLTDLCAQDRIALRYSSSIYPANPNGSMLDIAGICDATGLVFGLMPHPEDHVHGDHHPRHTRADAARGGLGVALFRNGVDHARRA